MGPGFESPLGHHVGAKFLFAPTLFYACANSVIHVSYTHLDVYKRQLFILLKYDAENQESCIFMGIDFYDMGLRL